MKSEIKKYVRGKNGERVGLLLAGLDENDNVRIGLSVVHRLDLSGSPFGAKKFDRDLAYKIAHGRSNKDSLDFIIPSRVRKDVVEFLNRCETYYKRPVKYALNRKNSRIVATF